MLPLWSGRPGGRSRVKMANKSNDWVICPYCKGQGHHSNPAIDAHGLTPDDFTEAGDYFYEDYFSGKYDVPCDVCKGDGKIRRKDLAEYRRKARAEAKSDAIRRAEIAFGA